MKIMNIQGEAHIEATKRLHWDKNMHFGKQLEAFYYEYMDNMRRWTTKGMT